MGEGSCKPLFSGIQYCTETLHGGSGPNTAVPYFPLNGETKYVFFSNRFSHFFPSDYLNPKPNLFCPRFVLDIKSSKEVSEYTATIAYNLLSEGKDGRQKVDALTIALRAEGMSFLFAKNKTKQNAD